MKFIAVLLSILLFLPNTAAYAEGSSLVVLGDSIASGYGLEGYTAGDNSSAPDSFGNKLGAYFTDYNNFAQDGLTTSGLLEKLQREDILNAAANADSTVISIGGNDFLMPMINALITWAAENKDKLESYDFTSSEEMPDFSQFSELLTLLTDTAKQVDTAQSEQNIRKALSEIRAVNPDCEIVILTVYNPFEDVPGMEMLYVTAKEKLAELNKAIAAAAADYSAETANIFKAFKGKSAEYTNIMSMDIHPSKAGHEVIFEKLCGIVTIPAAPAVKPMPQTGIEGISAALALLALSGAFTAFSRKKRS